jgi:serine/threonine-protein kinase HipA
VLAVLPLPKEERTMLVESLRRFAVQVEVLPDVMETQGVDHDIIDFLIRSIEAQVRQLKAL